MTKRQKKETSVRAAFGPPNTDYEVQFGYPHQIVVGVDEVGRGCLAGPVVAGAVVLPFSTSSMDSLSSEPSWLNQVTDSKLLTPEKREELAPLIRSWARDSAVAFASPEEIDRLNIHYATHLAMVRAVESLKVQPAHVLVDGKFAPKDLKCSATAIVKGDMKCLSIACASILAKVWRDTLMTELEAVYPGYGLSVHKGYPTPFHKDALKKLGVTVIHRKSFGPVATQLGRDLSK